jgi:hypothetical protein
MILDCCTLEDGAEMLARNVGTGLPFYAALKKRGKLKRTTYKVFNFTHSALSKTNFTKIFENCCIPQ